MLMFLPAYSECTTWKLLMILSIVFANSKTFRAEVALSEHLKSPGLWINLIAPSSFTSECLWPWILCSANVLWYLFAAYHSGKCCCNIFPENEKRSKQKKARFIICHNTLSPNTPSAEIFRWLSENIFGNIPSLLIRWQTCLFYLIMVVKLSLYFFIFLFSISTFLICLLSSWPHKIWLVMKRPNGPHWKLSENAGGAAD